MSGKWVSEDVLVEGSGNAITSSDALAERALREVTTRLWQTCCWAASTTGAWQIGDYRFLIIESYPSEDACLYLQFWSEPDEPVLMEVCSGAWNPGALQYVWHDERRSLEERGFVAAGKAKNFQKRVPIDSPDAAEKVAREALAIIFDIFRYRGACALTAKMYAGRRSEEGLVYNALEPEDFVRIATGAGFAASLVEEEQRFPLVALRHRGVHATAMLTSVISGTSQFRGATLGIVVNGHAALSTEVSFEGGVTRTWIENSLKRWLREAKQRAKRNARKREPRRTASQQNSPVVH